MDFEQKQNAVLEEYKKPQEILRNKEAECNTIRLRMKHHKDFLKGCGLLENRLGKPKSTDRDVIPQDPTKRLGFFYILIL